MIWTVAGAVFALISAAAAAGAWVIQYDQRLRLETMEQRVQSLQGTMGNLKQTIRTDAQKILREEMEAQGVQPSQAGGGMEDALMQMVLAQNLQGQQQPQSQPQSQPPESSRNGSQSPTLGNGGRES